MLIVEVTRDNIERALKMMRRKVIKTKLLHTLRGKRYHEKTSETKRLTKKKAQYIQKLRDEED